MKLTVNLIRYEGFILIGIIIAIASLIKLLGISNFSSDWFWFLAGLGLIVEGAISFVKQKRFDRKYKIIERKDIWKTTKS
jgi:hypothetical protein